MRDEHLDTIPATKLNEFIKSGVENHVPILSESEGEPECDMPACEVFTTFSNILFDFDYDFYSSDDQSFSDEDFLKEIYLNPLFDEEIISMKIDPHPFNAESDLIESLRNYDSLIISSSKIDSLFDEFADELTLLKSIPPGINETDCEPKEETCLIKKLLYDNSSPRPPKNLILKTLMLKSNISLNLLSPLRIPDDDFWREYPSLGCPVSPFLSPLTKFKYGGSSQAQDSVNKKNDSLSIEEKLSSESKRGLEKVVKSSQSGTSHSLSLSEKILELTWDWDKHAQPKDTHKLLRKLLEDLQFINKELVEYINSPSWNRLAFYDDDDKHSNQYKEYLKNSSNAIAPVLPTKKPDNSLSMGDEHLSTIPETESDEVIKSSVKNLVPIPSEFEDFSNNESECDVPVCDDFMTFSNPLFDPDDNFSSSDDELFSVEDLYDNSSPRLLEESNSEISDATIESFSPSHILVEDSDSHMEEIDLFLATDDLMPPGIENDDYDSEEDIHFLKELLSNDTLPLPENESSNFDHHDDLSFPRPLLGTIGC
nr:hypothetical protein [Tanacetum cinerariifolium]